VEGYRQQRFVTIDTYVLMLLRPVAGLAICGCLLIAPGGVRSAQIVDRNVAAPVLRVNGDNVALVTYSAHGAPHHVLYWGAVNWAPRFERDYSGGWKSKMADYKRFTNACRPYTGPRLILMIAACDAPDGSHWALQQWSRLWADYGGDHGAAELYVAHWRGAVAEIAVSTDYSYNGRFEHLWGNFLFHGRPVFGRHQTLQGVPTDDQGRNIYIDSLADSAWHRVNSFLTHPRTAGFCYSFVTHGPAASRAWNGRGTGDAYRATAIGPGVTPLVRTHFSPPPPFEALSDAIANVAQAKLLGDDPRCRIN
jgi:hypothetical protein